MTRHERLRMTLAGALAATAGAIAACGGASDAVPVPQQPPDQRGEMPAETQRDVHEVFHRLPQSCGRDRADEPTLERTTARFIGLYRR